MQQRNSCIETEYKHIETSLVAEYTGDQREKHEQ